MHAMGTAVNPRVPTLRLLDVLQKHLQSTQHFFWLALGQDPSCGAAGWLGEYKGPARCDKQRDWGIRQTARGSIVSSPYHEGPSTYHLLKAHLPADLQNNRSILKPFHNVKRSIGLGTGWACLESHRRTITWFVHILPFS